MKRLIPDVSRRTLLAWVGKTAGAAAMYQAMTQLGFAEESTYDANFALSAAPRGTRVLVLGAGVAGMTAAYELRKAGYQVQVLEYNAKAGGRCWTLRGGDRFTELSGITQACEFDPGLYFNPGPWRIPYHHYAVLDYCKRFGVQLEAFVQYNYNALAHSTQAFGGKPQRLREIQADFQGHIAELLSKAVGQNALSDAVSAEDCERLLDVLGQWGALDAKGKYRSSPQASARRGYRTDPGGGLMPRAVDSQPMAGPQLLDSNLWQGMLEAQTYEYHTTLFQPVGGMDQVARAFERQVGELIRYNSKVTAIHQDAKGVSVTFVDRLAPETSQQVHADWCVCTLPLSILGQLPVTVSEPMEEAIRAVPYDAAFKVGLQFKRRFWEQDENIYGGVSNTDQPIQNIGYPCTDYGKPGKGVLLGGYAFSSGAYEFTAMPPAERIRQALEQGAQLHPQYRTEFDNGIAVGWHRVPWTNGCYGIWTEDTRQRYYKTLCQIDGRIVLAGEHASFIPAWQEGAILSSLDAISRLHTHILASQSGH
ncbi:MAG: Flavin-dependent L-tryptophan oxidase RebO [Stenotrophomonas maltophilia]|nr:MAG: Flavin-dependent L-tryptophan oxidase RebO [Stenotrophomonas maltophilia]